MGSRSTKRRFWGRMKSWWRRKKSKRYFIIADALTEPAVEASRMLMLPSSSSTETPEGTTFEMVPEVEAVLPKARLPPPEMALPQPEGPPKTSPILLQAVTSIPLRNVTPQVPMHNNKLIPLPPTKVPSFLPTPLTKQLCSPDSFVRRRTKDSFQGSLESIDSLVESYWDPEEDASLATPVATNIIQSLDFLEEHVDFLTVQTQPRSVELVWESDVARDDDEISFIDY